MQHARAYTSKVLPAPSLRSQELKNRTWRKRKWSGPEQYEDKESGKLMMLPADMVCFCGGDSS